MYEDKLKEIGLSKNQAEIYSAIISNGEQKGSEITKKIGLSRQLTYKVLDELLELELIEKKKKSGSAGTFVAAHPSNLENLLLKKEQEIKKAQKELSATIDSLVSEYNLASGKPGVQFFEGVEGVQKVLEDTLSNKEETIYTYIDTATAVKEVLEIDKNYVQKRIKKGVKKKILVLKTPESEKIWKNSTPNKFTEVKLIDSCDVKNFYAVAQIYNGKVAYITFENKHLTTTIITDQAIYNMNRFIFESVWNKTA